MTCVHSIGKHILYVVVFCDMETFVKDHSIYNCCVFLSVCLKLNFFSFHFISVRWIANYAKFANNVGADFRGVIICN